MRSTEVDPNVRQMAAVQLRQYIAAHWSRQVDKFVEPEPPAEVCATAGPWNSAERPRRLSEAPHRKGLTRLGHSCHAQAKEAVRRHLIETLADSSSRIRNLAVGA